jgi:hypothetical protein
MLGMFVTGGTVWAGPSSLLDPYAEVAAPTTRAAKKQTLIPEANTEQTSTTYVNMDSSETKPTTQMRVKKPHFSLRSNGVKPETQSISKTKIEKIKTAKADTHKIQTKKASIDPASKGDGIVSGATTKIVDGTKSIGDGVASGTKKVGGGITSGAKASGALFVKGAKVIGGGFKGSDDKSDSSVQAASKKKETETKLGEEVKPNEKKALAEKKKDDAKKKDDKKKGNSVLSPISDTFKGTMFEIKDTLHAATDKLSLTKPQPGKDSAAERVAHNSSKKHAAPQPTYLSKGKPVKKSDGDGLVSKTLGKLPFVGGKKNADASELQVAKKGDREKDQNSLLTDENPRQTADKSDSPGSL